MRGWFLATTVVAVVLLPSAVGQEARITGFAPNLPGTEVDDAVWITNVGSAAVSLDAFEMLDNVGRVGFPTGSVLAAHQTIVVAGNATAFLEAAGTLPDYAMADLAPRQTMRVLKQGFALGQEGDTIQIEGPAGAVDVLVYGDGDVPAAGWSGPPIEIAGGTFLRWFPRAGSTDTDTSKDWEQPRRFLLGQSSPSPSALAFNGDVVSYLAPDHARTVVKAALLDAKNRLRLNVYELRDLALATDVADLLRTRPGLRVEVLLDAAPVGATRADRNERGHAIRILEEAGATVRVLEHARYGYNHAKYIIIDDAAVLVQSENLVPSGVPQDHASGNRGWGIHIANASLAAALGRVFDADFELRPHGSRRTSADDAPTFEPPVVPDYGAPMRGAPLAASGPGTATLLVAPLDPSAADPVEAALRGAQQSIRVMQLNFPPVWRDAAGRDWPHPYLEAIKAAAARGVAVQALLDGHFLGEDETGLDNADTAAIIAALPSGAARLQRDDRPVLHVKGLVIDDRWVLVGSMNWNLHSMLQNREVDVLLDHPESARFFAAAFDRDFRDATDTEVGPVPAVPVLATLLILASLVSAAQRRRPS